LQCERNVKLLTLTCEIFVQLLASQVQNGLILGRGKRGCEVDFSLRSKTNPDKPTRASGKFEETDGASIT
jgi:hypothetical protein